MDEVAATEEDSAPTRGRASKSSELSLLQRQEIAKACVEDAKKDTALARSRATMALTTLEAVCAQADVRMHDLKRRAHEFKRQVVQNG